MSDITSPLTSNWPAGEAKYIGDEAMEPGELFGAYVQSTVANGKIGSVDTAEALAVPGVVGYVSADDIPGQNNTCSYGGFTEEVSSDRPPSQR